MTLGPYPLGGAGLCLVENVILRYYETKVTYIGET